MISNVHPQKESMHKSSRQMIHLAGISICEQRGECLVRPCHPWQGRRLGRRPQQQLTRRLRLRSLDAPFAKPSVRSQRLQRQKRNRCALTSGSQTPGPLGAMRVFASCSIGIGGQNQNQKPKTKTKPDSVSVEGGCNRGSHFGGASVRRLEPLIDNPTHCDISWTFRFITRLGRMECP